jgi:polar amino acid transport system ATP-binding protein
MAVLEVANIKKGFGTLDVLKGVSFSLDRGQVLAIIGSSGSGKTTLLRCLNFLETPDEGEIRVNGKVLTGNHLTEDQIRENRLHFGLVFQNFNLFPQYTVLGNITLAPTLLNKGNPEQIREKALSLLEQVGLSQKRDAYPYQLSGGQQQRVAIARALASHSNVIAADEPTGNLDEENADAVMDLLRKLAHEQGKTVIVVTHDRLLAEEADRYYRLQKGKIVEV